MVTSCEPGRTSAYSQDLRWRMVWQKEAQGRTCKEVALNLGVDAATVSRTVARFRETGGVQKRKHPSTRVFRKLTAPLELMIIHFVLKRPGAYLHEIASELFDTTGADISLSTICNFLKRIGFTRQKLRIAALQRDDFLRAQFAHEVSVYNPEMFIFLDETGSDRRATIRRYGYSLRGKPLVSEKLLVRGKRVSAIAIMSVNGMLDCKTVIGSVNGEVFYDFVQSALLPHLMPFNDVNPNSVVVLDNCSIHHITKIVQMIEELGTLVLFLPPYSPDYNPIEEAFSKVKSMLKLMDKEAEVTEDLESIVLSAFSFITAHDCQQWINDASIYT